MIYGCMGRIAFEPDVSPEITLLEVGIKIMLRTMWIALAAGILLIAALPAAAHHSFAAVFDQNKPAKFTGTVTKVEWSNPHAWFYLDVKDDSGNVTNWSFEMGSPNGLLRQGWTRDELKEGDQVMVEGYAAKGRSNVGNARTVTRPDGRQLINIAPRTR